MTTVGATSTQTSVITTTILAGDGTSTVAASAGFTPLASVIAANQAIYPGHVERPQVTALPKQSGLNSLSGLMRCLYYYDCYPAEVNCIVHIRDIYTATEVYQATETVTSTVIAIGVVSELIPMLFCFLSLLFQQGRPENRPLSSYSPTDRDCHLHPNRHSHSFCRCHRHRIRGLPGRQRDCQLQCHPALDRCPVQWESRSLNRHRRDRLLPEVCRDGRYLPVFGLH